MINEQALPTKSCWLQHLSWSAIVAGALTSIGLSFLLNLFTTAIGLTAFNTDPEGIVSLAMGGFIGLSFGVLICMFFSGWVAGYLGRSSTVKAREFGMLYGLISWCFALIVTITVSAHAGDFIASNVYRLTKPNVALVANSQQKGIEAQQTNSPSNTKANASNQVQISANPEEAANTLGSAAFAVFILFFFGAIASCAGGYCGLKVEES